MKNENGNSIKSITIMNTSEDFLTVKDFKYTVYGKPYTVQGYDVKKSD